MQEHYDNESLLTNKDIMNVLNQLKDLLASSNGEIRIEFEIWSIIDLPMKTELLGGQTKDVFHYFSFEKFPRLTQLYAKDNVKPRNGSIYLLLRFEQR